jgi:hypothetical protein
MGGARVEALSVAQAEAIRAVEKAKGSWSASDHLARDVHSVVTNAEGRFRIEGLPPEPFELSGQGVQVTVEVRAGETAEVTLQARGNPRVRGHISGAQGPVAGAAIDADFYLDVGPFNGWSTGTPAGHSDADGNFDVELSMPGRYRFSGKLDKQRSKGVELNVDWDQVQWVELQLPEAKPASGG